MKINKTPEIAIAVFAVTLIVGFLIFNYFIDEESEATEIFNLPKESVSVDKQPTKYKRFDVKVKLTKYQLQKMLQILEEKNGYFDEANNGYIPALPQDYMTFRSVARGVSDEYEISSTQLSRYTGEKRVEEPILNNKNSVSPN
tara:strand:+ start:979 stop:1407 length:429 start_codon:yes stop_codon:yes gene_type:complete